MNKKTLSFLSLCIGISAHHIISTGSLSNTDAPWMPNTLRGNLLEVSGDASIYGSMKVKGALVTAMGNLSNIISPDGSVLFTPSNTSLTLQAAPLSGNVLRVDAVFGNDTTGSRNRRPFATINGALQAAAFGDVIILLPGVYNKSITIPAGVSIVGVSKGGLTNGGVRIAQTNVNANTDLVTMGENSRLENVTLTLNANSDVQLRGIVFPGTTSLTASVNQVRIQITNSTNGTAPAYGVHSIGTGLPTSEITALSNSSITVSSQGTRASRGILIDTAANNFNLNNCGIAVTNPVGGSAIGIETNIANASCIAVSSTISGYTADISQTDPNSSILLSNSQLVNLTANSLGFDSNAPTSILCWALPGAPGAGANGFITPGTGSLVSNTGNLPYILPQAGIIKNLNVQAITPPGQGSTSFTIYRNGVPTTLTTALSNAAISSTNNTVSVPCQAGDQISLQLTNQVGLTANMSVTVELY
jgi:hypothetical protein